MQEAKNKKESSKEVLKTRLDCNSYLFEILLIWGTERAKEVVELARKLQKEKHENIEYDQRKKEKSNWIKLIEDNFQIFQKGE